MPSLLRAWLPLAALAAGCADVVIEPSGGGGPAGGGDLGGAGTIDIEVIDERGLATAGMEVLSHTAEGALVARAVTAADGTAVIELPAGGLVSVLFDRHNPLIEGEERSIQSVKPPAGRQALRFVAYESQPDNSGPTMGPVVIDYGELGPNEGVSLVASCAHDLTLDWPTATSLAIEDYRGCPGGDTFDIYAYRVLISGQDIAVTDIAVIAGQPFTPGEGADLAFDWQPISLAETTWQLSAISGPSSAYRSAWWLVSEPYLLISDFSAQPSIDPLQSDTIVQPTAALPAETQCVSLGIEQSGDVCTSHQRTVCGPGAPAQIDWALDHLAMPTLGASQEAWTSDGGELGDYFEIRTGWFAADAAGVSWSLQVANDVSTRPTALELPDDLIEHFGPADDEPWGVFVNTVDVDSLDGFDAVLDTHGASPLLPAALPISRESVLQRPCPD